jgi:hypothetical protein
MSPGPRSGRRNHAGRFRAHGRRSLPRHGQCSGAVAAREVSRFARNSGDWQQFVEMCRVVDTLLIDGGVHSLRATRKLVVANSSWRSSRFIKSGDRFERILIGAFRRRSNLPSRRSPDLEAFGRHYSGFSSISLTCRPGSMVARTVGGRALLHNSRVHLQSPLTVAHTPMAERGSRCAIRKPGPNPVPDANPARNG